MKKISPEFISKVKLALEKMLTNEKEDGFVIVEEEKTHKFVQFGGGIYEELMIDLPIQMLSEEEIERCKTVLAPYAFEFDNHYDFQSFYKYLDDNNIEVALEIMEKIMTEIFLFDNPTLTISEN